MSTCPESLAYRAPAKLNLGLRVTGRRPDGYHELASLFWPLDICDDIRLNRIRESSLDEVSLTAEWASDAPIPSDLPRGNENLVLRAVRYSGLAADIHLAKRIPIGGGLGGGSSDAGSTLKALMQSQWVNSYRAHNLAEELGADVTFFLNPKPSWITGVGEKQKTLQVSPELLEKLHFVLVLLPTPCSTAEVFARFRGTRFSALEDFPADFIDDKVLRNYFERAGNDLTHPAKQICPEIGSVITELKQTPAWYADMSGSGSTCFAVYPSASLAHEAAQVIDEKCRSIRCKSLVARTFV